MANSAVPFLGTFGKTRLGTNWLHRYYSARAGPRVNLFACRACMLMAPPALSLS